MALEDDEDGEFEVVGLPLEDDEDVVVKVGGRFDEDELVEVTGEDVGTAGELLDVSVVDIDGRADKLLDSDSVDGVGGLE